MAPRSCALAALIAAAAANAAAVAAAAAAPPLRISVGVVGGQLPESSLLAAVAQAKASLAAAPSRSVLIQLPAGEFAVNTTEIPFELSGVHPAASAMLTIAGSGGGGSAPTMLRFDGENDVVWGRNTSRTCFRDLAFGRQRLTTSQGVVVSSTETTVTLDIQDGYPTPPEIMGDPERLAPGAGRWLRRYRQGAGGDCECVFVPPRFIGDDDGGGGRGCDGEPSSRCSGAGSGCEGDPPS